MRWARAIDVGPFYCRDPACDLIGHTCLVRIIKRRVRQKIFFTVNLARYASWWRSAAKGNQGIDNYQLSSRLSVPETRTGLAYIENNRKSIWKIELLTNASGWPAGLGQHWIMREIMTICKWPSVDGRTFYFSCNTRSIFRYRSTISRRVTMRLQRSDKSYCINLTRFNFSKNSISHILNIKCPGKLMWSPICILQRPQCKRVLFNQFAFISQVCNSQGNSNNSLLQRLEILKIEKKIKFKVNFVSPWSEIPF